MHDLPRLSAQCPQCPGHTYPRVPSKDASGKRLSGAQQKRKAAQRRVETALVSDDGSVGEVPVPAEFLALTPPPLGDSVAAVERWLASANLRAAVASETAEEAEAARVYAVIELAKAAGKLRPRAAAAEDVLELRRVRLFVEGEVLVTSPPYDDAVAMPVWGFLKLAAMAYDAARRADWMPSARIVCMIKALLASVALPCLDEHEAVVAQIEGE